MKRVGGKVTKIDNFFGRKSKSSNGKALAKLKKKGTKNKSIGRPHAIKYSWTILCLHYNIAIQMHRKSFVYTGCPRRNGQNFGRVFLMLNYTDITQNTYIQS